MYMYWNTESALTTESLDGYLSNLAGIKYSLPRSFVLTLGPNPPGVDPGRGCNRSRGVPFSKELLLQTGRLQQQTECIAVF